MRKWLITVAAASFSAAAACPLPTMAAEYLLGPQDKVRLKIYEWRASRDVIFEWTALNDEFVVGADGTLFLPFVGQIRAQGAAPADLSRAISDRLMQQMGLGRPPDVAVEIVQCRPFYIVGHVKQSGEYPYRPGLTVLQALGIAGGLGTRQEDMSNLQREVISGRGDVQLLALKNVSLKAKKARLEAELAGSDKIAFPADLDAQASDGTVALMMDQERTIFDTRKEALTTQLRALADLREFLEKELQSLEKQLSFQDKQIELVQKELAGVSSLVEKGLVVAPRELSLERAVAQMQSDRLSAETSLLRARQELSKTDISILELRNRQANEVAEDLRETQAQLNETTWKTDTAVQLLHETEIAAPALLNLRKRAEPDYKIVRPTTSGTIELAAEETTPLQPGDTLKVEITLPQPDLAALPSDSVQAAGSATLPGTN